MDKFEFDALADLKWLFGAIVVIWFVWFATGGPARYEATQGVFLKPPSPLSTGETYGEPPPINIKAPKLPDISNVYLSGNRAVLGLKANLGTTNPGAEYLEIVGQSDSPVNITGWKLVSSKGKSAVIGRGVRLFRSGAVNEEKEIYLSRGDRAIVGSGSSPVGASFRINSCSGYLEQFQDFAPKLSSVCPSIYQLSSVKNYPLDSICLNYIKDYPICETPVKKLPDGLSAACREFVITHTSYNACVDDHSSSADFLKNEWRVYLGSEMELWQDHDTIKFYDKSGSYLGSYTY